MWLSFIIFFYTFISIFLALAPNLKVDKVYSIYEKQGFIHNNIDVLELPPKDDLKSLVKIQFR